METLVKYWLNPPALVPNRAACKGVAAEAHQCLPQRGKPFASGQPRRCQRSSRPSTGAELHTPYKPIIFCLKYLDHYTCDSLINIVVD